MSISRNDRLNSSQVFSLTCRKIFNELGTETKVDGVGQKINVYGARFETEDRVIFVTQPAADTADDHRMMDFAVGAAKAPAVLAQIALLKVAEEKSHNKPVVFITPLAQCHNVNRFDKPFALLGGIIGIFSDSAGQAVRNAAVRQHWTLLSISNDTYDLYDSKACSFPVFYPQHILNFLTGYQERTNICLNWQPTDDSHRCGYFAAEVATRVARAEKIIPGEAIPLGSSLQKEYVDIYATNKPLPQKVSTVLNGLAVSLGYGEGVYKRVNDEIHKSKVDV